LQIYKDTNRNIILEESEGAMDTSQRIRNINSNHYDSSRMSALNIREGEAEEGGINGVTKTIIFERLSTVSS
jgi:hypothetical protein